jgi:hypothetical protein
VELQVDKHAVADDGTSYVNHKANEVVDGLEHRLSHSDIMNYIPKTLRCNFLLATMAIDKFQSHMHGTDRLGFDFERKGFRTIHDLFQGGLDGLQCSNCEGSRKREPNLAL